MLVKYYQQPDPDTILSVMNEPSKLSTVRRAARRSTISGLRDVRAREARHVPE